MAEALRLSALFPASSSSSSSWSSSSSSGGDRESASVWCGCSGTRVVVDLKALPKGPSARRLTHRERACAGGHESAKRKSVSYFFPQASALLPPHLRGLRRRRPLLPPESPGREAEGFFKRYFLHKIFKESRLKRRVPEPSHRFGGFEGKDFLKGESFLFQILRLVLKQQWTQTTPVLGSDSRGHAFLSTRRNASLFSRRETSPEQLGFLPGVRASAVAGLSKSQAHAPCCPPRRLQSFLLPVFPSLSALALKALHRTPQHSQTHRRVRCFRSPLAEEGNGSRLIATRFVGGFGERAPHEKAGAPWLLTPPRERQRPRRSRLKAARGGAQVCSPGVCTHEWPRGARVGDFCAAH